MSDRALNLVLNLRKKEEDEALELWGESKKAVSSFEQQIAQIKQFAQMYVDEMQAKSMHNVDMGSYMTYQQFILKLENIKERQEIGLIRLKEQEARARDNYLKKQQARKVIEMLLEKHKKERLLKELKADQKLSDELVSSKQARILIEKNLKKKDLY